MNKVEIQSLTNLPKKFNTNLVEIPLSKPSITDKETNSLSSSNEICILNVMNILPDPA